MPTDPRSDAEARYDEAREQFGRMCSLTPTPQPATLFVFAGQVIDAADALRASASPAITDGNGLLPCPFCGAKAWIVMHPFGRRSAGCRECFVVDSQQHGGTDGAIAAWNRRASAPRLCGLCSHSLLNNEHGFDQNDGYMDGDNLIHGGRCTYCRVCSAPRQEPPKSALAMMQDYVQSRDFYEVMQVYRHTPVVPLAPVVDAFEAVKSAILAALSTVAAPPPEESAP